MTASHDPSVAWPDRSGAPLACREKIRVLAENESELAGLLRDLFDDAILIGVDESWLRARLHAIVDGLESPRRA